MRLKMLFLILAIVSTVMSLSCTCVSAAPVPQIPAETRDTITWMGRCDPATIWALVALVACCAAVWKDQQHRLLVRELVEVTKESTKASLKQSESYENMAEALQEFKAGMNARN